MDCLDARWILCLLRGGELIGWHVSQGPDQLGITTVSRFAAYYQPDVIRGRSTRDQFSEPSLLRILNAAAKPPADRLSRTAARSISQQPNRTNAAVSAAVTAIAKSHSDDPIICVTRARPRPADRGAAYTAGRINSLEVTRAFNLPLHTWTPSGGICGPGYDQNSLSISSFLAVLRSPVLYVLAISTYQPVGRRRSWQEMHVKQRRMPPDNSGRCE